MKKYIFSLLVVTSTSTLLAYVLPSTDDLISRFKMYRDIVQPVQGSIPKVIEVPSIHQTYVSGSLVVDTTNNTRVPVNTSLRWKKVSTENSVVSEEFPAITDKDQSTFTTYEYTPLSHEVRIKVTSRNGPITSSRMSLILDSYVTAPDTIELYTTDNFSRRSVVAKRSLSSLDFYFPKTQSTNWEIVLSYTQPLRIKEIVLHDDNARTEETVESVRLQFLAQPNTTYRIYEDDGRATTSRLAIQNYEDSSIANIPQNKIQTVSAGKAVVNTFYKEVDTDSDSYLMFEIIVQLFLIQTN
jgi:hypothetical protein